MVWRALAVVVVLAVGGACASSLPPRRPGVVRVVAAENTWGDIARQIGGAHAEVTSIIHDPGTDPHLYEADPADAAAVAGAQIVIENGLGYDPYVDKLMSASPVDGRAVVNVARVLGGDGGDANPHLWYDTPRLGKVAGAFARQLAVADPGDAASFERNRAKFVASLRPLLSRLNEVKTRFGGTPVAYTERVAGYLLGAAGLVVKTPSGFARSVEEGNEPSSADVVAMTALLRDRRVRVLVYNTQATSAATRQARAVARRAGVAVVDVTETLPRSDHSFQSWQLRQLSALRAALAG